MQFSDVLLMAPKTLWKLQTMKLKDWLLSHYRYNHEGGFDKSMTHINALCGKFQQKFEGIEADVRKLQRG